MKLPNCSARAQRAGSGGHILNKFKLISKDRDHVCLMLLYLPCGRDPKTAALLPTESVCTLSYVFQHSLVCLLRTYKIAGSPGAPAQCCHTCSPWQRGAEQPRPPSEGHTGDGCRGARGAGQERRPCFHQGLREVSFEATRRSMPWLLKYIDKRGRLFMSGLSSNPMP